MRQVMGVNLRLVGACVMLSAIRSACRISHLTVLLRRHSPVLMTHWPSSLTRTHWLASSNSKSCSSSTRLAYSASFLRLRFRFRASHSGSGRAVDAPAMVYMGTAPWLVSFIVATRRQKLYCNVSELLNFFAGPAIRSASAALHIARLASTRCRGRGRTLRKRTLHAVWCWPRKREEQARLARVLRTCCSH